MTDDPKPLAPRGGVTDVTGEREKEKETTEAEDDGPDDAGPAGEQGSGT